MVQTAAKSSAFIIESRPYGSSYITAYLHRANETVSTACDFAPTDKGRTWKFIHRARFRLSSERNRES